VNIIFILDTYSNKRYDWSPRSPAVAFYALRMNTNIHQISKEKNLCSI